MVCCGRFYVNVLVHMLYFWFYKRGLNGAINCIFDNMFYCGCRWLGQSRNADFRQGLEFCSKVIEEPQVIVSVHKAATAHGPGR